MRTRLLKIFYSLILFNIFMALTACSVLQPLPDPPDTTYLLTPDKVNIPSATPTQLTLVVKTPKAIQAYNTKHMAYVEKPFQIAYFSQNSWADTPAEMLQPLIVQALQNTKHFRAVVAAPFIGKDDVVLSTQLLQLQQEFLQHPSQVRLSLRAQLINTTTREIIATKQFAINETAPTDTPYGGVVAANRATAELLKQLAAFCVEETASVKK